MKLFVRIDLEESENVIECECGEEVEIRPRKMMIILGHCDICDCPVGIKITDMEVIGGKDKQ